MSLDRFEQRRRHDRRRRWLRRALLVLVPVLVVALAWTVWFSSALAVRTVEVEGRTTLTEKQVLDRAQVPVGRPLARVDTVAIEERVSRISRVESVEVDRGWPHTIVVRVVERRPVVWTRVGGQVRAVDRYGIDYRTLAKPPKGLVEVSVDSFDARVRQQALEEAASVVERLRADAPDLYRAVQSVDADTKDSVTLDLTKGRTVTWGSRAKFAEKEKVLRALLRISARTYDVSAPEQPTTKK
ncbi:MAG: FtsQ-type POTRA domain-containing protein [Aeromicrobium erythreum]